MSAYKELNHVLKARYELEQFMKKHDVKYDWDDWQDVPGHKFIFPKDISDDIKQEIVDRDRKISWDEYTVRSGI